MFRLRERNKVRVDYFDADRCENKVLDQRHRLRQSDLPSPGCATQSSFDWRQFDITYTYSFIRNERFELGTGVALYFLQAGGDRAAEPAGRTSVRRRSPPRPRFRRWRWISPGASPAVGPLTGTRPRT